MNARELTVFSAPRRRCAVRGLTRAADLALVASSLAEAIAAASPQLAASLGVADPAALAVSTPAFSVHAVASVLLTNSSASATAAAAVARGFSASSSVGALAQAATAAGLSELAVVAASSGTVVAVDPPLQPPPRPPQRPPSPPPSPPPPAAPPLRTFATRRPSTGCALKPCAMGVAWCVSACSRDVVELILQFHMRR